MNSKEKTRHNLPHIHVSYKNKEMSVSIIDGTVLAGNINSRAKKKAIDMINEHKRELELAWNTMTDGEKIFVDDYNFEIL